MRRIVLANAFHLMLRPGADVVAALGGIHRFCGWDGHVLTDSGGFQVHSLGPRVDDDGVTFSSVYDGSSVRLTPETAVEVQGLIGADIQMVLDVCATLPAGRDELRRAVERTADWAERARRRHRGAGGPARGPGHLRHRPGRHGGRPAGGERGSDRRTRLRRLRRRRAVGGGAAAGHAGGPGRHRAPPPRDAAPIPDGRGRPGRAWSRRWPSASTSSTAWPRPAWPATARCSPAPGGSTCATR